MVWLLIVSVVWGLSFGLIGNALAGFPSGYVACVRLVLSLIVFLPFLRKVPWKTGAGLAAIGAVQFGLMYVAYIASFGYMASYEVAIFTIFTPIYLTVFDDIVRRKVSPAHVAACVAVLGAGVVLWREGTVKGVEWTGFWILQFSNACFALGQLVYARWKKPFEEYGERSLFGWLYLGAVLVTLPFVGADEWAKGWEMTTPPHWWLIIYLGVVASGLCFFLWDHGARMVSPARLAVMNNLKIPLGAAFSLLLFKEEVSWLTLVVGMLLLVVSIAMSRSAR